MNKRDYDSLESFYRDYEDQKKKLKLLSKFSESNYDYSGNSIELDKPEYKEKKTRMKIFQPGFNSDSSLF